MSDEQIQSAEPAAQHETHEGFLTRIEAAVRELPNPSHLADWLKQELTKFRA